MTTYWLTAAEIARVKGWTVRNVTVMASRYEWRSKGYAPVMYNADDVADYLEIRKVKPPTRQDA